MIYGAPTSKINNNLTGKQRHKRQTTFNYENDDENILDLNQYFVLPEQKITFKGLLGLKILLLNRQINLLMNRLQIRFKFMQ